MKKFSLIALVLCAAMIGCDKKGGSTTGSSVVGSGKPSPTPTTASPTGISTIETPKPTPNPTTGTAPPATAPVGT